MRKIHGKELHALHFSEIRGPGSLGFPPVDERIVRKISIAIGELRRKEMCCRRHSPYLNPRLQHAIRYYRMQIARASSASARIRNTLTEAGFPKIIDIVFLSRQETEEIKRCLSSFALVLGRRLFVARICKVKLRHSLRHLPYPYFRSLAVYAFDRRRRAKPDFVEVTLTAFPILERYGQVYSRLMAAVDSYNRLCSIAWEITSCAEDVEKWVQSLWIDSIFRKPLSGPWDLCSDEADLFTTRRRRVS